MRATHTYEWVHVGWSCRVHTFALAFPLKEIHTQKKCCWWNHVTKSKMFCKYVCLSVNVYVCMNVSCCWKCAAEFFFYIYRVAWEASKWRKKKEIKHFAASLLKHFHQRNTNGYNTQTMPRFERKWIEIAHLFFCSWRCEYGAFQTCIFVVFNQHALYDMTRHWPL